MSRQADNEEGHYFQMERFAIQNGFWFYMTRENTERGPFTSKTEAEGDLIDYIMQRRMMEQYGQ